MPHLETTDAPEQGRNVPAVLLPVLPRGEMWCALRETHGIPLPSSDAVAVLLATYPPLRGLSVRELAERLDKSEAEAQHGIAAFVADTFGASALMIPGASLDVNVMRQGRPAPPVKFFRDSRGRLATR